MKKSKVNMTHAGLSALLVLVIFVAVLIAEGIAPFGDSTFLMFDLKRQYVDYYAYYKTVLSGENNVRYSFSTTLGSGTLGFFAYYLTSPFLILVSIADQAHICSAISLVIGLKLMLAALIMDAFLQVYIRKADTVSPADIHSVSIYLGAVSWAFSGFLFAHSMNMMWTDVIILFPLYILSLEALLREDKRVPYIAFLWAMLVLNYYITFQVILFTALWTIMRIVVSRYEKPFKLIGRVILSAAVSGAMSAALLLPTALELMNSPKDISKLGLELTGKNLTPIDIFSKFPTTAYDYIEARFGYPQIYCGVLLVFLLLMYFMSRKIDLREKLGMLCLFVLLMISFCLDIVNLIWHAGMEPSGHPYRQAYLFVFIMIICAVRVFGELDQEINIVKMGISFAVMVVGLYLIRLGKYDHISDMTVMLNFGIIVFYAAVMIIFLMSAKRGKKLIPVLLVLMLVSNSADLFANAVYTHHYQALKCETENQYRTVVTNTLQAVDYVKENDRSFYRMENLNPRQQNDALQYNYNGITHYSSAGMIYVRYFLQRLGFNDDTLYTHYGRDNTETADSLLGVKYHITDDTASSHHDYEKIYEGPEDVYRNPYALSAAIGTLDYDLVGISDPSGADPDTELSHVPALDAFSLQEEIYSRLLKRDVKIFADAEVDKSDLIQVEGKYVYDYQVTALIDGEMYFYLDGLIGETESLSIFRDGEFLTTYGNAACVKVLNLGYMKAGDTLKLRVLGEDRDYNFGRAIFVTEDVDALAQAYGELKERNCEVTKKSSSHLMIETGACNGVFLTVPFEKGWKITVDGQRIEPVAIYDSLTYVPIDTDGQGHTVEMIFMPEGLWIGVLISLLGLLFLVYFAFSGKKGILL